MVGNWTIVRVSSTFLICLARQVALFKVGDGTRTLVEDVTAGAARQYTIHGCDPKHEPQIGKDRVHFSACGETVQALDLGTREYRPSSLRDVYGFARLADALEHIHMVAQTVISNELSEDVRLHDANLAYALLSATTKHGSMAVMGATSVDDVYAMAHMFAGGEDEFRKRPFFLVGQYRSYHR